MINQNLLLTGDDGYNLTKSLRFRSSASAYLNRTPSVSGSGTTFTWSGWIKRGILGGGNYMVMYSSGSGDANIGALYFGTDDKLNFLNYNGSMNWQLITTQVFRDPSAWYHVVVAVDTTQATSSNRIKFYVNGSQITAFDTATYPSLNYASPFFNQTSYVQFIGRWGTWNASHIYDGYMTEINFVDGQQLTPSSFGETDVLTGVWKPKKFSGTYGTNGFYLPFTNTASTTALGYDFSGNSNNWTTNNFSISSNSTYDSMKDVPTLTSATTANYCVMNPLNTYSTITVSDANLKLTLTQAAYRKSVATMAFPSSGLYYLEGTVSGGIDYVSYGIVTPTAPLDDAVGNTATGYGAITGTTNWDKKNNGTTSGNFWTISTSSPTLQIAYNATSGKLWLGYNNTWLDGSGGVTGNPSAGTNETFTVDTTRTYLPSFGGYKSNSIVINLNFGQQPFTYTPPTGFKALNTFNLPEPSIKAGNKYMDVNTYTGNGTGTGSTQTISNGNFQPDFIWIKSRSTADYHNLNDSVRGIVGTGSPSLFTNTTGAEATFTGYGVSAVTSTGFTLIGNGSYTNNSGTSYVGWQWKANGTGSSNTAGSITSTVSANPTAGFSVVTYTGTGSAATIGHGLGVTPSMILLKCRTVGHDWRAFHGSFTSGDSYLRLNTTAATASSSTIWNGTLPTSSVFSVGTDGGTNQSSQTFVAYCFAEVAGYSKFGSYTGNGSTDGTFVHLGFRPKYVMVKRTDSTNSWIVYDTVRDIANVQDTILIPNDSGAEVSTSNTLDILSNGFKLKSSEGATNGSGGTYIYMAFAENPFKYSLAR